MHIFFPVARPGAAPDNAADAGQLHVSRDPEDESEWQYLGNPQIAARTSLREVVERFIQDCSGPDGKVEAQHRGAARMVRDALLAAARQVDDALGQHEGG